MKKKILSLLLAGMLSASLMLPAAGAVKTPFSDIPENHWASEAVADLYQNGIMKGTSESTFSPASVFTRAMFVTMLGRLEGVDTTLYSGRSFSDVPTDSWYAPYVCWASEVGVVNGTSATAFSPNAPITREQYCTIMNRYIESKGKGLIGEPNAVIEDIDNVSSYALTSVKNMVSLGLCNLYGENQMFPRRNMARVEIAGLFCEFTWWLQEKDIPIEIPAYNYSGLYASDYLGMKVKELKALYGSDIATEDGRWYYDGKLGLYYTDDRLPCSMFYTDAPGQKADDTAIDLVQSYHTYGERMLIAPGICGNETYTELTQLPYTVEFSTDMAEEDAFNGVNISACLRWSNHINIVFGWYEGEDPYTDPAGLVSLYYFA